MDTPHLPRREFVKRAATVLGAMSAASVPAGAQGVLEGVSPSSIASSGATPAPFNAVYEGARLNRVAFPMGGMGAGMICLEVTGALSHVSIRNSPDVFNAPFAFAAIAVKGTSPLARVLERPVPGWKLFGMRDTATGVPGESIRVAEVSAGLVHDALPLRDSDALRRRLADVGAHYRLESVGPGRR